MQYQEQATLNARIRLDGKVNLYIAQFTIRTLLLRSAVKCSKVERKLRSLLGRLKRLELAGHSHTTPHVRRQWAALQSQLSLIAFSEYLTTLTEAPKAHQNHYELIVPNHRPGGRALVLYGIPPSGRIAGVSVRRLIDIDKLRQSPDLYLDTLVILQGRLQIHDVIYKPPQIVVDHTRWAVTP